MHLLSQNSNGGFSLTFFATPDAVPPYAILSHRWGSDEVDYQDIINGTGRGKSGYHKLEFCAKRAEKDALYYFWVDTCCIDKKSSAEYAEAINSMFRFYREAAKCYVYFQDVRSARTYKESAWWTRGWTLQELIAPPTVEFFNENGVILCTKESVGREISICTGIPIGALRGDPMSKFSVEQRLSWTMNRVTTRAEDRAYCLLGIFDVFMPPIYGEGEENAMARLKTEIDKVGNNGRLANSEERLVSELQGLKAEINELKSDRDEARKMAAESNAQIMRLEEMINVGQEWRPTEHGQDSGKYFQPASKSRSDRGNGLGIRALPREWQDIFAHC